MYPSQRYVSKELTHFVGQHRKRSDGGPDEEAQYGLLVRILKTGQLLFRASAPNAEPSIVVIENLSFSRRKMYNVDAVCFCDIPVDDMHVHMQKYSEFGVAFLKSTLVKRRNLPPSMSRSIPPQNHPFQMVHLRAWA